VTETEDGARVSTSTRGGKREVADRTRVANQDGVWSINGVVLVPGYFLASDYKLTPLAGERIGDTGRLKVLRLSPSNDQVKGPCFIGRWDEKAQLLDFDAVDGDDYVDKAVEFTGHHPTALPPPGRRFDVEVRLGTPLLFKGIVSVALGYGIHAGSGTVTSVGPAAEFGLGTAP
jgi:hypothetical protein